MIGVQFSDPRHKSMRKVKGFGNRLRRMERKDRKISELYHQQDIIISMVENLCNEIDCEDDFPPGYLKNLNKLLEYIQLIDTRARSQRNGKVSD